MILSSVHNGLNDDDDFTAGGSNDVDDDDDLNDAEDVNDDDVIFLDWSIRSYPKLIWFNWSNRLRDFTENNSILLHLLWLLLYNDNDDNDSNSNSSIISNICY